MATALKDDLERRMHDLGLAARDAARELALAPRPAKDAALQAAARLLRDESGAIEALLLLKNAASDEQPTPRAQAP